MAVVGDEQVDVPVVVVVAGADALSPALAGHAGLLRHVRERAVAVVPIQVARRCASLGEGPRLAPLTRKTSGQPSLS